MKLNVAQREFVNNHGCSVIYEKEGFVDWVTGRENSAYLLESDTGGLIFICLDGKNLEIYSMEFYEFNSIELLHDESNSVIFGGLGERYGIKNDGGFVRCLEFSIKNSEDEVVTDELIDESLDLVFKRES